MKKNIGGSVVTKDGIPPFIKVETVCRVLQKAGLKWTHFQRKGIMTKNDLKLRLKFAGKVCHKRVMCNYEIRNHQKAYGTRERVNVNSLKSAHYY